MRKRTGLALMMSAALVTGCTLFCVAGPALASETDVTFCTTNSPSYCMTTSGSDYNSAGNYYQIYSVEGPGGSTYNDENGSTWSNPVLGGSDPVYEWYDPHLGYCLDWYAQDNRYVEYPCSSGNQFEEFWRRINGEIVNVRATDDDGELECVNLIHVGNNEEFDSAPCTGNENQTFKPT
jgi:hypothetical protein